MNAFDRNKIIKRELMAADDSDTSVILNIKETSASIRNEHDTDQFLKARMWWVHGEKSTVLHINPVLSTHFDMEIENCDCDETFLNNLREVVSQMLEKLGKDYE